MHDRKFCEIKFRKCERFSRELFICAQGPFISAFEDLLRDVTEACDPPHVTLAYWPSNTTVARGPSLVRYVRLVLARLTSKILPSDLAYAR